MFDYFVFLRKCRQYIFLFFYLILPKVILLYCLILIILLQFFGKVGIFVSFKINQKYIASNICEKKDIPQNACAGKCFLKKALQKENQEAEKSKSNNKNIADFYIKNDVYAQDNFLSFVVENHFFVEKNNNFPPKNTNKLLRPPQTV